MILLYRSDITFERPYGNVSRRTLPRKRVLHIKREEYKKIDRVAALGLASVVFGRQQKSLGIVLR